MATVIPGDLSEVRDTQKVPSGKRKRGETKPRKNFPCQLCDKAFNSVEKLKVHSYTHTGERPYKCTQQDCTKAFVSKYKLLRYKLLFIFQLLLKGNSVQCQLEKFRERIAK